MSDRPHERRCCRPSIGLTRDGRVRIRWPNGERQILGLIAAAEFHDRLGDVLWDAPVPIEPADRRGADHGR
jgi:hypothetical protein